MQENLMRLTTIRPAQLALVRLASAGSLWIALGAIATPPPPAVAADTPTAQSAAHADGNADAPATLDGHAPAPGFGWG